jgi:hypothetical protein
MKRCTTFAFDSAALHLGQIDFAADPVFTDEAHVVSTIHTTQQEATSLEKDE